MMRFEWIGMALVLAAQPAFADEYKTYSASEKDTQRLFEDVLLAQLPAIRDATSNVYHAARRLLGEDLSYDAYVTPFEDLPVWSEIEDAFDDLGRLGPPFYHGSIMYYRERRSLAQTAWEIEVIDDIIALVREIQALKRQEQNGARSTRSAHLAERLDRLVENEYFDEWGATYWIRPLSRPDGCMPSLALRLAESHDEYETSSVVHGRMNGVHAVGGIYEHCD